MKIFVISFCSERVTYERSFTYLLIDELEVGVQYMLALLLSDLEGQLPVIRVHLNVHHSILILLPATSLESIVTANL